MPDYQRSLKFALLQCNYLLLYEVGLTFWETSSLSNCLSFLYLLLYVVVQVLVDSVGVPCRLVKGHQYTGSDDVAMNFVKIDDGR